MPAYRLPPTPAACAVGATRPSAVTAIHHSLFMGVSSLDKSLGPVIGRAMPVREVGGAARAGSSGGRGKPGPCPAPHPVAAPVPTGGGGPEARARPPRGGRGRRRPRRPPPRG